MKKIKKGVSGPSVEVLQLALRRAGYSRSTNRGVDGVFGEETREMLIRYQNELGIGEGGTAGVRSWNALRPWIYGYREVKPGQGDTLYSMAARYSTTIRAIETANPQTDIFGIEGAERIRIPMNYPLVPEDVSMTSVLQAILIKGLRVRYPFIETWDIGKSVLGRPLQVIKIGKGGRKVFYNGTHHAQEWITAVLLLKFAEEYARSYAMGEKICGYDSEYLYNRTSLYIMPLVNPDGADLVTGELEKGSPGYERAASLEGCTVFPEQWRANINGVDLNLQYPAGWEMAREIKYRAGYKRAGYRDYVGERPLSEPESRAVYELSMKEEFDMALAYHTQGEVIYRDYMGQEAAGAKEIGDEFAALSGYAQEQAAEFSGHAGYKDWFIKEFKRPAFTIEAGLGRNPLPLSQLPSIYRKNIGILTYGLLV